MCCQYACICIYVFEFYGVAIKARKSVGVKSLIHRMTFVFQKVKFIVNNKNKIIIIIIKLQESKTRRTLLLLHGVKTVGCMAGT